MLRFSPRLFCQLPLISKRPPIPGLHVFDNVLKEPERLAICGELLRLREQISKATLEAIKPAQISRRHNLSSLETYQPLKIQNFWVQNFQAYGEKGHELMYLSGRDNIPAFIKEKLLPLAEAKIQTLLADSLTTPLGQAFQWNTTLNFYGPQQKGQLAGFDFHVDLASNGEFTLLFPIYEQGTLEFRKKDKTTLAHTCPLKPGSIIILEKEARWEWEHRVLPPVISPENELDMRISVVLGCSPAPICRTTTTPSPAI